MKTGEKARSVNAKEQQQSVSPAKRGYILGLLTAIYSVSYMDRNVINVLLEPIKREFVLSDTMMGLMVGFGFVVVYCIASLPVAWYSDRKPRIPLIAWGLVIWSVLTAVGGLATNAWHLFFARLGVGATESAGTSPSQSIIADLYPKNKRPKAMAVFAMSVFIGVYLGFTIGGLVSHYHGWRVAFFVVGIPGILIAILLTLTVKEPIRGLSDGAKADTAHYSLRETIRYFKSNRTLVLVLIGNILISFTAFSTTIWMPAFLRRIHHLNQAQVGLWGGSVKGLLGIVGVLIGGFVVERISRRDDRWKLLAPAIASFIGGPVMLIFFFAETFTMAMVGLGLAILCVSFYAGPMYAVIQSVVKVRMRTLASATAFMTGNIFSYGGVGLIIGMLNDALNPRFGVNSIRYSLISATITSILGAICFFIASRTVARDIELALKENSETVPAEKLAT